MEHFLKLTGKKPHYCEFFRSAGNNYSFHEVLKEFEDVYEC